MLRNITSLIFIFFWGLQAKASYPAYVGNKKIKVSDQSFNRYIKPQLRNLYNDYFYLIKELGEKNSNSIQLFQSIDKIEKNWKKWIENCSSYKEDCSNFYSSLIKSQQRTDKLLLDMLQDEKGIQDLETLNELSVLVFNFQKRTLAFKNDIFRFPKRWKKETSLISSKLSHMKIYAEMILTKDINSNFKKDFDYVWVHFFKKINLEILKGKKPSYLISRLEELNWAWNTFHMKVSKGQKSFNKRLLNTVKIMHSRWNSILKVILNT